MHEISRGAKNPHEAPKLTELRDKLIQATTGDIAGVISHLHGWKQTKTSPNQSLPCKMLRWRRRSGTLLTLMTETDVMLHWRRRSSTPLTLVTETDVMLHWRPGTPLTLVTETDVVLHWRRPAHHVKILPTWMGWMVQRKSCKDRQSKSFV